MTSPDLPDPLRRHTARLQALRAAERDYHDALRAAPSATGRRAERASQRGIDAALERLVDAVVAFQEVESELHPAAGPPRAGADAQAAHGALQGADPGYDGYLAARTYDQVRSEALRRLSTES